LAAAMTHGRHRQLGLFSALLAGGFFRPQRIVGRGTGRAVGLAVAAARRVRVTQMR
jgi:hypothetical protein